LPAKKVAKSESLTECTRTHWSPKTMAINSGEEKGIAHPNENQIQLKSTNRVTNYMGQPLA